MFGIGSIVEEILKCNNLTDKKISSYAITKIDQKIAQELIPIIQKYKNIISVEAHYINGGIGSMIAEIIAENQLTAKLYRLGVRELSDGIFGDAEFMYRKHKISDKDIFNLINKF